MRMKSIITKDQIQSVAEKLLRSAKDLRNQTKSVMATAITLSGDLGAGKTTLTQRLATLLGVKEHVISPTFVIMKKYKTTDNVFKNLIHIDTYRLDKSSELENLGWQELRANPENLIILEWPERVPEIAETADIAVLLEHVDEETRSVEF
jgi:tRNA threonylcarbamoyladenosine biosynthesis protein TsaE